MKLCLFADVNPNLIDGSTIWLQSVGLALDKIEGAELTVLLRESVTNDQITKPLSEQGIKLESLPGFPAERDDLTAAIAGEIEKFIMNESIALAIVRGDSVLQHLALQREEFRNRIWAYWLGELNFIAPREDPEAMAVFEAFRKILVQSMAHKAALETLYHVPAGKVLALPPMVPDTAWEIEPKPPAKLTMVYSGKLDADYCVEDYLKLPEMLKSRDVESELLFLGDKFNSNREDKQFVPRMRERLSDTADVTWLGGMDRFAAMKRVAQANVGLGFRSEAYDSSLEISTKLVEFCALGVPPIVNPTMAHQAFLGADYPFFANTIEEVAERLSDIASDLSAAAQIGNGLRERAKSHSLSVHAQRLQNAIERAGVQDVEKTSESRRIVIAGHDLKFLHGILPILEANPNLEIRYDNWVRTKKHDEAESERLLAWADTIFCEWCTGAAIWYSNRVSENQRVIVRLHRFEIFGKDPEEVDFANVDRLIVVSDYFKKHCVESYGIDASKVDIVPQFVDWQEFNRPKHPGTEKTLGFVGINAFNHKRFDRAVELLARLRKRDDAWRLRIRSVMPWDLGWMWKENEEAEKFKAVFQRISGNPSLAGSILFDPPGPDMAEWFRNVNFIISTSESEGCHTSVAEGMATGAYPLILNWPGATSVYPEEFVSEDLDDLADLATRLAKDEMEKIDIEERAKRFDLIETVHHFTQLLESDHPSDLPAADHTP